jgi:hypothetical protein
MKKIDETTAKSNENEIRNRFLFIFNLQNL